MTRRIAASLVAAGARGCLPARRPVRSGSARRRYIAPGVDLFQVTDHHARRSAGADCRVLAAAGSRPRPVIESALSNDEVMEAERVDGIAERHKAIAAVNAGFLQRQERRAGGTAEGRGRAGQRHHAHARRDRHSLAAGRRASRFYFDQASARCVRRTSRPTRRTCDRADRRRGHHARARQADAVYAGVSRRYGHGAERHRVGAGRQAAEGRRYPQGPRQRRRSRATARCCRSAASSCRRRSNGCSRARR